MRRVVAFAAAALCLTVLPAAQAGAQDPVANQDYVSMGDSYSSGTGTRTYYDTVGCERSIYSYPHLIDPQIPGTHAHVACGGAKTQHVTTTSQRTGVPPQADWLGTNTDYASISIGGNDAGFTEVLLECGQPSWSSDCDGRVDEAQAYIQNTLPGRLDSVYSRIRSRAPNATVSVLGYPRIFNTRGEDCNAATFFSAAELTRLNQTADMLAEKTRERVQAAGFSFVDSRPAFVGHGVCDDEWINGLSNPTTESYHPKREGYVGFAGIVRAALLASPRPGQIAGPNGRIAFASTRDGNSEIYAINGNGSFPVKLTDDPAADVDPAWSPDGTKLAFASNRDGDNEIYVLNASGTLSKLTSNTADDRDPTWSPNGDLIAFRSDRTGNNEVFKMTSGGASQTNLTNNSASDFAPDWSPDGSEIAFQRFVSGGNNEVWRMNADGQGQMNLSSNAANDGQPAWAPDGNTIAFHSNRDGDFEIFTMSRAGASVSQRTANAFSETQPAYSPNGASIAFTSNRDGNDEIYTATSTGSSQTRRTTEAASDTAPSWQGDRTPPETSITSGPSGVINTRTPTFVLGSNEPGSTFTCRIDGGAYASCGSPYTTPSLADGQHTFDARATDPSGNLDTTPASRTFTVDATPATTAITSGPTGLTNDTTPTFEFASNDPQATFECKLDGGAFSACSSPFTTSALADGEHTFTVRGTDSAGNPDPQPASATFTVDATAPDTTIDFGPGTVTNDPTPSFEFSASEAGATFECRLDSTDELSWESCASPKEYAGELGDGSHRFEVRAIDAAGNTDASPATSTFTIDTAEPETTLHGSPPPRRDRTPTFEFSSSESGGRFECRLDSADDADWVPCSSPFTTPELADGEHTFEVRAADLAGNTDATPAKITFSVDATAPETTITAAPSSPTNDNTPTFSFSSDDPDPAFECRVDAGAWEPCDQTFTTESLGDGSHTFEVRATDEFGNVDASPASRTFTVDTAAPETTLAQDLPARTRNASPTFTFSSNEAGSFECRLDGASFVACSSPHQTARLSDGSHTFEVRAIDAAGNADPSPGSRTFTVDTAAPESTIAAGPSGPSNDPTPTFSFGADEPDASFECRTDSSDDADWVPCDSPHTTPPLRDGPHTFEVRAIDDVGNVEGSPASRSFSIDTVVPQTAINQGPGGATRNARPSFGFDSTEEGGSFECRIDRGTFSPCRSPFESAQLGDGEHTFSVRATDAAGNTDPTPAARSFRVDTRVADPTVAAKRKQRIKRNQVRVKVEVGAGERASARGRGKLILGHRVFRLSPLTVAVEPGRRSVLALAPRRSRDDARVRRALARGRKVRARLTVTLTDAVGNRVAEKRSVRLR